MYFIRPLFLKEAWCGHFLLNRGRGKLYLLHTRFSTQSSNFFFLFYRLCWKTCFFSMNWGINYFMGKKYRKDEKLSSVGPIFFYFLKLCDPPKN